MRIQIDKLGAVTVADGHTHAPSCPDPNDPGYPGNDHQCWLDEYRATHDDTPWDVLATHDTCPYCWTPDEGWPPDLPPADGHADGAPFPG